MKKNNGLLVVISGPSGVGKNTIITGLVDKNPDVYVYSISATTRSIRGSEKHGVDYFFMSVQEFEVKIKNGEFIEYAIYQGDYYGTPKFFIEENLQNNRIILLDIDVQGALKIMNSNYPMLFIFIAPLSTEVLFERLKNRGTETETKIRSRIEAAQNEMKLSTKFDKIVINNRLDDAVTEIETLINQKIER